MLKILVLSTGGTIESAKINDWVSLDLNQKEQLLRAYETAHPNEIDFEVKSLFSIHSENLTATFLNQLTETLLVACQKPYDGIVVLHGTDTLAYSAAAAALCLGSNRLPVVFVSSNYPLLDPRANGAANFEGALAFLREKAQRGVFVSYTNDGKTVALHAATEVFSHLEMDDAVYSVGGPVALYQNGRITFCKTAPTVQGWGSVSLVENPKILNLPVTPLTDYEISPKGYHAVVLTPYHSGTVSTASSAFVNFCHRFHKAGVPILLPDVPKESAYDSMREYERLGLTVLPNLPRIITLMQCWFAVSLHKKVADVFSPS